MILDDLRVQHAILIHLYKNITTPLCVSDVKTGLQEDGEYITSRSIRFQAVILERKGLLSFIEATEDALMRITGDGCREAESEMVRKCRSALRGSHGADEAVN